MTERYAGGDKIGTPSCAAEAGIPAWKHEADKSYGKGEWTTLPYRILQETELVRKNVSSAGWAGKINQ